MRACFESGSNAQKVLETETGTTNNTTLTY